MQGCDCQSVIESDRIMFLTASGEDDPMLHDIAAAAEPQTAFIACFVNRQISCLSAEGASPDSGGCSDAK